MSERKPQDQDKFIIRLPHGLRDRIKAAADQNGRSMNSEIVAVLLEAFPDYLSDNRARLEGIASVLRMYSEDPGVASAIDRIEAAIADQSEPVSLEELQYFSELAVRGLSVMPLYPLLERPPRR